MATDGTGIVEAKVSLYDLSCKFWDGPISSLTQYRVTYIDRYMNHLYIINKTNLRIQQNLVSCRPHHSYLQDEEWKAISRH